MLKLLKNRHHRFYYSEPTWWKHNTFENYPNFHLIPTYSQAPVQMDRQEGRQADTQNSQILFLLCECNRINLIVKNYTEEK